MTFADAALVIVGAVVGAPVRFWVSWWVLTQWGCVPTRGTLIVNVAGSFALGLLVGGGVGGGWLALVGTGFCGALTTFSTLALEVWEAIQDGSRGPAAANVALSLVLGTGAAALGWWLGAR
ncbi:MAG: fluoride efflux transporter FluC [Dermatophilaceae bacterium]